MADTPLNILADTITEDFDEIVRRVDNEVYGVLVDTAQTLLLPYKDDPEGAKHFAGGAMIGLQLLVQALNYAGSESEELHPFVRLGLMPVLQAEVVDTTGQVLTVVAAAALGIDLEAQEPGGNPPEGDPELFPSDDQVRADEAEVAGDPLTFDEMVGQAAAEQVADLMAASSDDDPSPYTGTESEV